MNSYSEWFHPEVALVSEELLWPYKHLGDACPDAPEIPYYGPVVRLGSVSKSFDGVQACRSFSLHPAQRATRSTVCPAVGMPEVIEAPAPISRTGSELSIRSECSRPGVAVRGVVVTTRACALLNGQARSTPPRRLIRAIDSHSSMIGGAPPREHSAAHRCQPVAIPDRPVLGRPVPSKTRRWVSILCPIAARVRPPSAQSGHLPRIECPIDMKPATKAARVLVLDHQCSCHNCASLLRPIVGFWLGADSI
jgi:hypothetical protein